MALCPRIGSDSVAATWAGRAFGCIFVTSVANLSDRTACSISDERRTLAPESSDRTKAKSANFAADLAAACSSCAITLRPQDATEKEVRRISNAACQTD